MNNEIFKNKFHNDMENVYYAAKQLIHTDTPSEGFTTLWELKRLDLSVEAHVIKSEYAELFTDNERQICLERLEAYGYKPNGGQENE